MVRMPHLRWWMLSLLIAGIPAAPVFSEDLDTPKALKNLNFDEDAEDEDDEEFKKRYGTRVETPLIGEYTTFAGLTPTRIEGVGLVVGLQGTGGNPAPSIHRTALVEDLKRRNVKDPNGILKSPDTALVYLRAMLPPLLEKGETVDVQVWIPDSADATSLEGGWLMEAILTEQAFVPGKGTLSGHPFAKVKGPILTSSIGANKKDAPSLKKRGVVLGGGKVIRERELSIHLRNDFRLGRNSIRVATAISKRFHDFDKHGIQLPMAVPKNDQRIKLEVHPKYKNNFPRYLQVIRHIAFREEAPARRLRLQKLRDQLLDPEKAERAALQLEGIGSEAIPVLKHGLTAPLLECRMHAACALAYLGESDGVAVLEECVRSEPSFRVFALAALSVIDDADAHIALRKLMHEASMETRYGAFRALWVLDKDDPFIQGELVKVMEGRTSYMLHEVDAQGDPLVHLTTRTRPEVVLFGANQKMTAPLYLTAGKHIMVTAQAGAQTASVRRFAPNKPDEKREVPLNVADIVRTVSELDGTYPDVVQLLTEAAAQHNLPGRFAHDSLPEAGRVYERPASDAGIAKKGARRTRIGRDTSTPNLFARDPDKEEKTAFVEEAADASSTTMSSVSPEKTRDASAEKPAGDSGRRGEADGETRKSPESKSKEPGKRGNRWSNVLKLPGRRPPKDQSEPEISEPVPKVEREELKPPEDQSEPN